MWEIRKNSQSLVPLWKNNLQIILPGRTSKCRLQACGCFVPRLGWWLAKDFLVDKRCKCHDISTTRRAHGIRNVWIRTINLAVWATLIRLMHLMDFWTILIRVYILDNALLYLGSCMSPGDVFHFQLAVGVFSLAQVSSNAFGQGEREAGYRSILLETYPEQSCYSWYGDLWREVADRWFGCHYT